MATHALTLTRPDRETLGRILATRSSDGGDARTVTDLLVSMCESTVIGSADAPRSLVTLNSRVLVRMLGTGAERELTLVVPGRSDSKKGFISVLTPVGSVLLGRRAGDTVVCDAPAGSFGLRIEAVLYQPEAAGDAESAVA